MDRERFFNACRLVEVQRGGGGIGTLREKTLHAILKYYFEPDLSCHEVKVGRYVADIATTYGIVEIQTRGLERLRGKLTAFLHEGPVTVVYPIAYRKWISWIDPQSGERTKRRRSPKMGNACEAFFELYKIKPFLRHPNLHICLVLLDMDEYRLLNGWSDDKKRGASRYERIPIDIRQQILLSGPRDYRSLVSDDLLEPFSAKDFAQEAKLSVRMAQLALHVLDYVGAVERVGKRGNAYLYRRRANFENSNLHS